MSGKRKHKEKGIDWANSAAKIIILEDLKAETLPLEESACTTEEAWNYYKGMIEFQEVPYPQFEKQLKAHREQMNLKDIRSMKQWEDFKRLRQQHPEPLTYDNGRRIFRQSAAYELLRTDVYAENHRMMTPSLFRTTRPEYKEWDLTEFSQRIFQMERQKKFVNYLEKRRDEEKKKKEEIKFKTASEMAKKNVREAAKKAKK